MADYTYVDASLRHAATKTPFYSSFMNEYIWDSKKNNVKMLSKTPDNGRLVTKTILPDMEVFMQYDRAEEYDWTHVKTCRARGAVQQCLDILTAREPFIGEAMVSILQLSIQILDMAPQNCREAEGHPLLDLTNMIRKSDGFQSMSEVNKFIDLLMFNQQSGYTQTEYQQSFRILKHATHIAWDEPSEYSAGTKEVMFNPNLFPHSLMELPEFRLEHGFLSHREPYRTKRDTAYFVGLLHRMKAVGRFIPDYTKDDRMFPPDTWKAQKQTEAIREANSLKHFTRRIVTSYKDMDDTEYDPDDADYDENYVLPIEDDVSVRLHQVEKEIPNLTEELKLLLATAGNGNPHKKREHANKLMEKISELNKIQHDLTKEKQKLMRNTTTNSVSVDETAYTKHNSQKGTISQPVPRRQYATKTNPPEYIYLDNTYPHHDDLRRDDESVMTPMISWAFVITSGQHYLTRSI